MHCLITWSVKLSIIKSLSSLFESLTWSLDTFGRASIWCLITLKYLMSLRWKIALTLSMITFLENVLVVSLKSSGSSQSWGMPILNHQICKNWVPKMLHLGVCYAGTTHCSSSPSKLLKESSKEASERCSIFHISSNLSSKSDSKGACLFPNSTLYCTNAIIFSSLHFWLLKVFRDFLKIESTFGSKFIFFS